ncbi:IS4 family transposase [Roseomonas stagni]|uniref:IS4 family transposase n=1 Tax=Falsiroseomonas algicola TaxID=2716930 RepID=A0A6M1LY38_9PROT|nr:IS4 family transposase [Falsiroseomonas algicola]
MRRFVGVTLDARLPVDCFGEVLARLPSGIDLDDLARRHGALSRRRRVVDAASLLRLLLAAGPGGLSLRQAAAWSGLTGIASLSNPALKARLDQAGDFLDALIGAVMADRSASAGLRWHGRCLRLADGTCLHQPGRQGVDWRIHAVFDLGQSSFSHLELTDGRGAEALDRGAPVAGEIRIADRGFGRTPAMARFREASKAGADLIVRIRPGGVKLRQPDGTGFDLHRHLASLPAQVEAQDVSVLAQVVGQADMPLRLVLQRKPPAARAATEKKVRRKAQQRQQAVQPTSIAAAGWLILTTTLPQEDYPASQVLAAYRLRWQIELAFKRLKSLLHIDQLRCHSEPAIRRWIAAHLLLALLSEDISQDFLAFFP